jgi:uncharacterized membrane protein YdbT with pleckstrin-like domain
MSYVESQLIPGETVQYRTRVSWWSISGMGIFLGLAAIVGGSFGGSVTFIVIGVIFLIFLWLSMYIAIATTELAVTNRRVIAKAGLISRRTVEMQLDKVESIHVQQGILDRLTNAGSIVVAGSGTSHAPFLGIDDPMQFRRQCLIAIESTKPRQSPA